MWDYSETLGAHAPSNSAVNALQLGSHCLLGGGAGSRAKIAASFQWLPTSLYSKLRRTQLHVLTVCPCPLNIG